MVEFIGPLREQRGQFGVSLTSMYANVAPVVFCELQSETGAFSR